MTNTTEPNPNPNVYKHYLTSIYYLLAIFVFFRVATIFSLMIQDAKFGDRSGDTRNHNL